MKDSDDREEKKKTNRSPSISMGGESFWNVSYSILLQPESQVPLGQDADTQASWGVTASWRSNSQAGQGRSASRELGPWASRGMSTFWDPWTGGSVSRLRHDNLLRTRSLVRLRPGQPPRLELGVPKVSAHMEGPLPCNTFYPHSSQGTSTWLRYVIYSHNGI